MKKLSLTFAITSVTWKCNIIFTYIDRREVWRNGMWIFTKNGIFLAVQIGKTKINIART